jgi:hypothetical protein
MQDEHIHSLLDECWNRSAEMKITAEQSTKAMRRLSVSAEAAEAVLQEATKAPAAPDATDSTALLEDILSMVKALHVASAVPSYAKLMFENGGSNTVSAVLDRASLQLHNSSLRDPLYGVRRDILEGCVHLLERMVDESSLNVITLEAVQALVNSAKAVGTLEFQVPAAIALVLRVRDDKTVADSIEGVSGVISS